MEHPEGWQQRLWGYFCHHRMTLPEAQDCAQEVCLRYARMANAPLWGQGDPPDLLWRLAHDVLCEYCRRADRHAALLKRLAQERLCVSSYGVEARAIDALDADRFTNTLPGRLREVLELRLQGYTVAEIAKHLSLSPGTVKAYLAELRRRFVKYYGYDPTKTPSSVGNIYGGLSGAEASTSPREEDRKDARQKVSGVDGGRSVRGERARSASHARGVRRAGGGRQTQQACC